MSNHSSIGHFSRLLDFYPAAFSGNRLNLLMLEDAIPIKDSVGYLRQLNSTSLTDEKREYLVGESCPWPFTRIRLVNRPDPWDVSEALFTRFGETQAILPTQGEVAEIIEKRVRHSTPKAIALIIVDGLSYYDLPTDTDSEAIQVSGITSTAYGYRTVIGRPSISRRLFTLGYSNQLGFTYFDQRINDLARDVYASFAESQVTRVKAFTEILERINTASVAPSYIQITMAGLDQLCHAHWDQPPVAQYLQRILENLDSLLKVMHGHFGHSLVVLTADHGILWREHIESRLQIIDDIFTEDLGSPRYIKGSLLRPYGRICRCNNQNYTLFQAPYMTRRFRNNEWGVHGGISAWESIVPFIVREA